MDERPGDLEPPFPEWALSSRLRRNLAQLVAGIIFEMLDEWPATEEQPAQLTYAQHVSEAVRDRLFISRPDPDVLAAFDLVTHIDRLTFLFAAREPDLGRFQDRIRAFGQHLWP